VLGLLPLALCSISTAAGLLEIWWKCARWLNFKWAKRSSDTSKQPVM
jgi:hypothetical protein